MFIERLWCTIRYEEVYLRVYDPVSQAKSSLSRHPGIYNTRRPHSRPDHMTPGIVCFNELPQRVAA